MPQNDRSIKFSDNERTYVIFNRIWRLHSIRYKIYIYDRIRCYYWICRENKSNVIHMHHYHWQNLDPQRDTRSYNCFGSDRTGAEIIYNSFSRYLESFDFPCIPITFPNFFSRRSIAAHHIQRHRKCWNFPSRPHDRSSPIIICEPP